MKILWLTWKDMSHPAAGGAEVVNEELAKRLAADGHEVRFVVGGYEGCAPTEERDGFSIIRVGGRFSVYWRTHRYYKKHLSTWPDLVIDEVNTMPFFAKFYVRERNLLFVHQLCREIWFYQMPFPLSIVGYLLEPLYLWLLRDREVVTVSESTKRDLMRFGFKEERIHIISEGIELAPVADLDAVQKFEKPTMLALGAIRPMKRTDHIVRAFELAKERIPDLELVVAGKADGAYGKRVLEQIARSPYRTSIRYAGAVSKEEKVALLQRSHVLTVASVKEGWGLVVTEANSQGTPAVVYDVDGLRDSVRDGETGLVAKENTPEGLAAAVGELLADSVRYGEFQKRGWEWSGRVTFERGYQELKDVIHHA